ncbi:MAG: CPBP family intramembrane glutamic endopeptidase [bacterium]
MNINSKILPISNSFLMILFFFPSIYFFVLTRFLLPYLNDNSGLLFSINWFICGFLIFIPLFVLATFLIYKDGFTNKKQIIKRLRLQKVTKKDWKYIIISTISIFVLMLLIMGASKILNQMYGIKEIQTTPPFMKATVFIGWEKLYLLIWAVMFFFNIYGEELLWRGYILTRQEITMKNKGWVVNSLLWLVFHFSFGLDLLILLLPIIFILPYSVYKTKNTNVGIIIHALINGPSFILISLGIIGQ